MSAIAKVRGFALCELRPTRRGCHLTIRASNASQLDLVARMPGHSRVTDSRNQEDTSRHARTRRSGESRSLFELASGPISRGGLGRGSRGLEVNAIHRLGVSLDEAIYELPLGLWGSTPSRSTSLDSYSESPSVRRLPAWAPSVVHIIAPRRAIGRRQCNDARRGASAHGLV